MWSSEATETVLYSAIRNSCAIDIVIRAQLQKCEQSCLQLLSKKIDFCRVEPNQCLSVLLNIHLHLKITRVSVCRSIVIDIYMFLI